MSDLVRKEGEFFNAERELALDIMEREEELLGTAEVIFSGSTTAHRSEQLSLLEQQIRRYEYVRTPGLRPFFICSMFWGMNCVKNWLTV